MSLLHASRWGVAAALLLAQGAVASAQDTIKIGVITDRVASAKFYAEPVTRGVELGAKLLNDKGDLLAEKGYVTPQNADPRLIFTPTEAGTFRIVVRSFQEGDRDAYLLTIRAFGKKTK